MKSILTLLRVEMLKLKRSLALLMVLICPLMVVLLNTGMFLKNGAALRADATRWQFFWAGNLSLWAYFMLPLFIALLTALLNHIEHKNAGWRLMLCLPVSSGKLFFCKALLATGFVWIANLCLWLLVAAVQWGLQASAVAHAGASAAALALLKVSIGCLPVLVIQHALAWKVPNIVAPLALGVCATMGVMQIGSSQYWVVFPWSYGLMAGMGSSAAMQQQALLLAVATGAGAYLLAHAWLTRQPQA